VLFQKQLEFQSQKLSGMKKRLVLCRTSAERTLFPFRDGTSNLSPKLMGCLIEPWKMKGINMNAFWVSWDMLFCSSHIKHCRYQLRHGFAWMYWIILFMATKSLLKEILMVYLLWNFKVQLIHFLIIYTFQHLL